MSDAPTLLGLIARLRHDHRTQLLFARYLVIGGFVFCIDVGSFQLLLKLGLYRPVATTSSFVLAFCTHFSLNRFFNFRRFDRPMTHQFGTYLTIVLVQLLITNAVVEVGVRVFGLLPVVAKVIAVALNLPLGFLGHRYLTFGAGIAGTIRRMRTGGRGEFMP